MNDQDPDADMQSDEPASAGRRYLPTAGAIVDTEVTVGDVQMAVLPAGDVEVDLSLEVAVIDINFAAAPTQMALNSDQYSKFIAPPDHFGFYNRGSDLKVKASNQRPCLLISAPPSVTAEWFDPDGVPFHYQHGQIPYKADQQMAALGKLAIQTMQSGAFGSNRADQLMAEALVTGISARLIASAKLEEQDHKSIEDQWHKMKDEQRLAKAVEHAMDRLPDSTLKIADLAVQAGMSTAHFGEVFKRAYGMGPYAFILSERLNLARRMVTSDFMSLGEIAYASGFSSQSHMTTNFSKAFGVTPAKMRR